MPAQAMVARGLTLDAWSHIFEHVNRSDLLNICLVSKSFKGIATRILYRSITLVRPGPRNPLYITHPGDETQKAKSKERGHWSLLSRLEDNANQALRNLVQEVILCHPATLLVDSVFLNHLQKDDCLSKLLASLPNLRHVTIGLEALQTGHLIGTICAHSRKPEVSLELRNFDKCIFSDEALSCISSLDTAVDPHTDRNGPNTRMLAMQWLFFNCPNLRSFKLSVFDDYGGCVMNTPSYPIIETFQLTGEEQFPPLQELTLDGYYMNDEECVHWQNRFQWDNLSSLTVGPGASSRLLGYFAGYATSLVSLKVSAYPDEVQENRKALEKLLTSFNSLATLELKGYICSVKAIGYHKSLSTLFLHEDEPADEGSMRRVLTVEELVYLDTQCPNLTSLTVDIRRSDNKLPDDVLRTLATRFKNLNQLSIHFELGLKDVKRPIKPLLNYTTARSIGQSIFEQRKQSGILISPFFTLTFWSGNCYRRWPQWEPEYCVFEEQFTATHELRLPSGSGEGVEVRHLQKERLDQLLRERSSEFKCHEEMELQEQVRGAVEGPKEGWEEMDPDI